MRAGVRYIRHAAPFRAVLARTAAFVVPASALWALLPLFARRGLGLSALAYNYIGGLKTHARADSAVTAPTVNSSKRLKLGSTTSGATWAPVWISYGYNNRTQMLRIPGPGRIEDRTIDGSCNPYLAAAAVLSAGLDGSENGLDAGEPNSENLYSIAYDELSGRVYRGERVFRGDARPQPGHRAPEDEHV